MRRTNWSGDLTAVDSVAFDARQGEILGFLGSNGAEKTTTKNMRCTLLHRPLDVPVWMKWLSKIDPWTYGVDHMRQVDLRESVPAQFLSRLSLHPIILDMAIIVGFSVLFIVPVVWLISK